MLYNSEVNNRTEHKSGNDEVVSLKLVTIYKIIITTMMMMMMIIIIIM
jgi:hypothetical protein